MASTSSHRMPKPVISVSSVTDLVMNTERSVGAPRTSSHIQVLSGGGCDGQHAAEQGGPLQGPHALLMKGHQRGVVARVERGGLFPQRALACQPARAVPDLNVGEARLVQASGE